MGSERFSLDSFGLYFVEWVRMKRMGEFGLIIGVSLSLALVSFAIRPSALPWSVSDYEIELDAALELEGPLWVDARAIEDFEAGSYAEAISVNEESWEDGFVGLLDVWMPDAPIVVFCSSQSCLRSHHVAARLRGELGIEEVYTLKDGWESLLEAGLAQ